MAETLPVSPRVEVKSFAHPTLVGRLDNLSTCGLEVWIDGPLPSHLEPGLNTDLCFLSPAGDPWIQGIEARVHRLRGFPSGTTLDFTYRGPLPRGSSGKRFQALLDRRGATRVRPPRDVPVRMTPLVGGPLVRAQLFDLSASGVAVDISGPLPAHLAIGAMFTLRAWDGTLDLCLEVLARVRRMDLCTVGHRVGLSFDRPDAPVEVPTASIELLLENWRSQRTQDHP